MADQAALAAVGLTVTFGGVTAVDDLDLTVAPGQIAGLIGPNGAGKTTVLNVVSGFVTPRHGRVLLHGTDLTRAHPQHRARAGLSRTFQTARLFRGLTVRENLEITHRQRPRSATSGLTPTEALELTDLGSVADLDADRLEGGQRRFCELARALTLAPRVLLLDEPSSGLSEDEVDSFGTLLRQVRDELGLAALVVSHDMRLVAATCSEVTVMDFGRVLGRGTADEVRANPQVQAAYFGEDDDA